MKKTLFILSLTLLLSGCSFKSNTAPVVENTGEVVPVVNPIETTTQEVKTFGLIEETLYTSNPSSFSGCTLLTQQQLDSEPEESTGVTAGLGDNYYKCQEVNGYNHTYSVSSLGIRLTYDRSYDSQLALFLQKDPQVFLATNQDSIYDISNPETFIKMISKDPTLTPDQMMQTLPVPANCIYTGTGDEANPDLIVYTYEGNESNDNGCSDSNGLDTRYVFSKTKSDYYYQEVLGNGCAPGPCSFIEGKVELFLK